MRPHGGARPSPGGKDVPAHGTTWLGLEDIVLSDIGQSQGDRHRGTPLARGPKGSPAPRDRTQKAVPEAGALFNGDGASV